MIEFLEYYPEYYDTFTETIRLLSQHQQPELSMEMIEQLASMSQTLSKYRKDLEEEFKKDHIRIDMGEKQLVIKKL